MRFRSTRRLLTVLLGMALIVGACGGDDDADSDAAPTDNSEQADDAQADDAQADDDDANGDAAAQGDGPENMDELGLILADGLIPELSSLPVPEGAGFVQGNAASAQQDPEERAVQRIYFEQSVDEIADFYRAELEGAGWELTGDSDNGETVTLAVTDPDGHSGQLIIESSAVGPPTFVQIQISRAA